MCQYTSIFVRALPAVLALGAACGPPPAPGAPPGVATLVALRHVAIVDAARGAVSPDMTVLIRGRVIDTIAPTSSLSVPPGADVVDAPSGFLIPGMWDMHVHSALDGRSEALEAYVRYGVTTVRDMGSRLETIDSLRRAIDDGRVPGPRILAAGPMIENDEAMRYLLDGATPIDSEIIRGDRLLVRNPTEGERAVDSLAARGVAMIKFRDVPDVATYWAIARRARRVGRTLVGHPAPGVDPLALADSGQRSVEHWYFPNELPTLPRERYDSILAAYRTHGTAFTPTLRAWHQHRLTVDTLERELRALRAASATDTPRAALFRQWEKDLANRRVEVRGRPATSAELDGWRRALDGLAREIGHFAAAGIVVLAGSDMPFATRPGEAFHEELRMLVTEAGLTPAQALVAATTAAAQFSGMHDSLGTIAAGKIADLVLLERNPLIDIGNARRIVGVMRDGRWVRRPGGAETVTGR